jgi:hypothetical protein
VHADLDALLTALCVLIDDFLPGRRGPGHPPQISDAQLIALAVLFVGVVLPPGAYPVGSKWVRRRFGG